MKAFFRRPLVGMVSLTLVLVLGLALFIQPALADGEEKLSCIVVNIANNESVTVPTFSPDVNTFYGTLTVSIKVPNNYSPLWSKSSISSAITYENDSISCSTLYGYTSSSFSLTNTATLYAVAYENNGYRSSSSVCHTYTRLTADTPAITLSHGQVTINGATDKLSKIYYTTDGSDPTINSNLYSVPFSFPNGATTIKAVVFGQSCPEDTGAYGQIASISLPSFSTGSALPDATLGTPYSQQLLCTGTEPIEFSLDELKPTQTASAGALRVTPLASTPTAVTGFPAGLTLSSSGLLSGTPTATGTYSFTVWARNSIGVSSQTFSLTVLPAQDEDTGALQWYTPSGDAPSLGESDSSEASAPQSDVNPNTGARK